MSVSTRRKFSARGIPLTAEASTILRFVPLIFSSEISWLILHHALLGYGAAALRRHASFYSQRQLHSDNG
jgi:hypothetical protein